MRLKPHAIASSDMPRLTLSGRPANEVAADLLVLPVAAGDGGPVAPPVTRAVLALAGADLAALGRDRQLGGDLDQSLLLPTYGRLGARALLLLGVGRDSGRSLETLRRGGRRRRPCRQHRHRAAAVRLRGLAGSSGTRRRGAGGGGRGLRARRLPLRALQVQRRARP